MKIYTKTGDKGTTSLFGGKRLPKDDLRIEAYGTIDELNAQLGLLAVSCKLPEWEIRLANIQSLLFTIGAHLAADPEKSDLKLPPIPEGNELELESLIDEMEASLPPLKNFVLPGGNTASALAHVCRTICRRAERRVVSLISQEPVNPIIVVYLNRLSDFLFVFARHLSYHAGAKEIIWRP
ncbi:MAG: cob(I)yrinic acid a,c-diamide adenosyltransferase [Saprospiraceae bacterium]|nr:cob(I)yrinic acid a,c-diamide adenosyltransferase [Saprospiraceae bacterium]MBP9209482.1 cob(I)yrinic acid a,c-diamide adenosyltransferase [Saprospiraceae bacterium]MBV6471924.1 Cob(I)yrinic acid a,c-diamide adenosyltransferase [Saprospiraceae bacterium]